MILQPYVITFLNVFLIVAMVSAYIFLCTKGVLGLLRKKKNEHVLSESNHPHPETQEEFQIRMMEELKKIREERMSQMKLDPDKYEVVKRNLDRRGAK
jgi:hypothetical protein